MKKSFCRYFIFFSILGLLACFYYIICYYQMRFGDDVLFSFYMGFKHYLDGADWKPIEKVTTVGQALKQYIQYYLTFSGRIPYLFQGYLFNLLGERVVSIISALIYTGTILLVGRIGLKSWKAVIGSPAILLLCSLYMYQLTPTGTYICMWTFVCQYGLPTFLYLLYYFIITKLYMEERVSTKRKLLILSLGFICGLCHECLGAFAILLVGIKALYERYSRRMPIKRIWINVGLFAGYAVILLAPGNYKRLFLSHDLARAQSGILSKLQISIYEHLISAGVLTRNEIWMVLIFGIAIIYTYIKRRYSIFQFIKENLELIIVIIISIPVWAVFAPPVPQYGLQLWKACVVILMLKAIDVTSLEEKAWNILAVVGVTAYIAGNFGWTSDLVRVTSERRMQISEAKDEGEDVVYLKQYPESTYGYLTMYNYANQKDAFGSESDERFYGIKIIVE